MTAGLSFLSIGRHGAQRFIRQTFLAWACFLGMALPAMAVNYYVDFVGGSDANTGLGPSSAFKYCPGDMGATLNSLAARLHAGDNVYFKKGVIYQGQQIIAQGGDLVLEGHSGHIAQGGVLSDALVNYTLNGVRAGDLTYVYNSDITGALVDQVGVWNVSSVSTSTSLVLSNWNGLLSASTNLAYRIVRPVNYTSLVGWGAGEARISGSGVLEYVFRLDDAIHLSNLVFENSKNIPGSGCLSGVNLGTIWDNNHRENVFLDNVTISNVWAGFRCDDLWYSAVRNCVVRDFDHIGITGGRYSLVEGNIITNGTSAIRGCGRLSVTRYNSIRNCNKLSTTVCNAHGDGIGPFFSPNSEPGSNVGGWVYANLIENTVEGMFLSYENGGTSDWVFHSNILIGNYGNPGGSGDAAVLLSGHNNRTRIYNNLIFGLNGSSGWVRALSIDESAAISGPSRDVQFMNNIIWSVAANPPGIIRMDPTTQLRSEGNIIYVPNGSPKFRIGTAPLIDLATWKSLGFDNSGHTFVMDPQLQDVVGLKYEDLNLQARVGTLVATPFVLGTSFRDFGRSTVLNQPTVLPGPYQVARQLPPTPTNVRVVNP
ncbi:MAG: hypothetical protein HYR88_00515 [Verrucomicrobia bacterium]|nr:hypothetical protein [Verrucomicrobiota bacterium]MBI3869520.1 hypothetical protein [Verrucomicrobiota bacterium]